MKQCVAEIICEREFSGRMSELYDLNCDAMTAEDTLEMKIILSQEYIPYEEYEICSDIIKNSKDNIHYEQYDIETALFNELSRIRENRRLDNIRLVFVKSKMSTDCVNKLLEYLFEPIIDKSNEHKKQQYNLQSHMCRIWRRMRYKLLIEKRLYYITHGTHERKRFSYLKVSKIISD